MTTRRSVLVLTLGFVLSACSQGNGGSSTGFSTGYTPGTGASRGSGDDEGEADDSSTGRETEAGGSAESSSSGTDPSSGSAGTSSTGSTSTTGTGSSSTGSSSTGSTSSSSSSSSTGSSSSSSSSGDTCTGAPPPGSYADCVNVANDIGVCGYTGPLMPSCLVDDTMNPTRGVCTLLNCTSDCDCFGMAAGSSARPSCWPVLAGNGKACVLLCTADVPCPAGMFCEQNFCWWPRTGP